MDYFKLLQELHAAWCKRHGIATTLKSTPTADQAIADAEAELYGYGGYEAARIDAEMRRLLETNGKR